MRLELSRQVRTDVVDPGPRVLEVAAMFGLGVDASRMLEVIPPTRLDLHPGELVFITGPSGGGKSTLLRLIRETLAQRDVALIDFDALKPLADGPVIEALAPERPVDDVMRWLSLAGLGDAFVMLRRPSELSEGQRYRLKLAQAMAKVESAMHHGQCPMHNEKEPLRVVVVADEFAATLDRLTAKVVGRNLRRWMTRMSAGGGMGMAGVAGAVATSHDDLLEALEPDVLVEKPLGEAVRVARRDGS